MKIEGDKRMAQILLTGATGMIGTELTKHLKDKHDLTLVDVDFSDFPDELQEGTKVVETDLVDHENWKGLLDGIEYVVQLAGQPSPDAEFYGDLEPLNYELPHNLWMYAQEAKDLKRIIFASSIHAVDSHPNGITVKASDPVRPNDLYGVSKVYLEALGAYHAYTNGIPSIGIRIANYTVDHTKLGEEVDDLGKAMFFSARDMNHLIDCCIEAELDEPYLLVNGISNNTFPRLSLEEAQVKLGYEPVDNAFEMPQE